MKPAFNQRAKYRMIQSSERGKLLLQGGFVFDEGGNYRGPAPAWGPDLFVRNGQPIDTYEEILSFAESNYREPPGPKEAPVPPPIVESRVEPPIPAKVEEQEASPLDELEEMPVLGKKKGRPRKGSSGSRYGSGPV